MALVFTIQRSDDEQFYFTLSADGKTLLTSERYTEKSACNNGIASVQENAGALTSYAIETADNGQLYFNIIAANGQIIATSVMFDTQKARQTAILQAQQASKASIESL